MRIAFIDHHLNNFHADKFLSLLRANHAADADLVAAYETHPTGDDWCEKNGVPRCASLADAVDAADAVFVLAPDDVTTHLELAEQVLPAGKPTVIDKFLAPTAADAEAIVACAAKHGTPIFSSSSLRFSVELEEVWPQIEGQAVAECYSRGLASWDLYACHTLSPVLRIMGSGVRRVIDTGTATARCVTLDFGGGRRAQVAVTTAANEWDLFGWNFGVRVGNAYLARTVTNFDGFYANLIARCVEFCRTGEAPMEIGEAVMLVKALEAANRSLAAGGEWITL